MRMMKDVYYRTLGVRYMDRLVNQPHVQFTSLPRLSLFHYVPGEVGPAEVETEWPIFKGYSKKIQLRYITEYVKTQGVVRRPMFNMKEMVRPWLRKHRNDWEIVNEDTWVKNHNPENLIVLNYGYLDVAHKYQPVQLNEYYRWLNRQRTVWTKVAEIAKVSNRNQFLYFPMPSILQGRTTLDKFAPEQPTIRMEQVFGRAGWTGYMQLDLWRWLSPKWRQLSLISLVRPKDYPKINLVFIGAAGNPLIVNLGYLNSWLRGEPNQTDFGSVVQYDPVQMQKISLKMAMVLNAMVVEEDGEGEIVVPDRPAIVAPVPGMTKVPEQPDVQETNTVPQTTLQKPQEDETSLEVIEDLQDDEPDETEGVASAYRPQLSGSQLSKKTGKAPVAPTQDPEQLASVVAPDFNAALFADLEKDIEALDRISLTQLKNTGIKLADPTLVAEPVQPERPLVNIEEVKAKVFQPKTATESLQTRLAEDAEANLITATQFRKLTEARQEYLKSPDPYGSNQPRIKAMVISPEDTTLTPEEAAIQVPDFVDPTMAQSSLQAYDAKYINTVMKKDILRVVDAIQSPGVAIRRHEVDVTHSALGSYEHHVLELLPVDGAPSTIKFTFPTVDEEGVFLAGGNKYALRKQRVD